MDHIYKEHNGWTNYETWHVNLLWTNEIRDYENIKDVVKISYKEWRARAADYLPQHLSKGKITNHPKHWVAEALQNEWTETLENVATEIENTILHISHLGQIERKILHDLFSTYQTLVNVCADPHHVNWVEIAEHWLDGWENEIAMLNDPEQIGKFAHLKEDARISR